MGPLSAMPVVSGPQNGGVGVGMQINLCLASMGYSTFGERWFFCGSFYTPATS